MYISSLLEFQQHYDIKRQSESPKTCFPTNPCGEKTNLENIKCSQGTDPPPYQTVIGVKYSGEILSTFHNSVGQYQNQLRKNAKKLKWKSIQAQHQTHKQNTSNIPSQMANTPPWITNTSKYQIGRIQNTMQLKFRVLQFSSHVFHSEHKII